MLPGPALVLGLGLLALGRPPGLDAQSPWPTADRSPDAVTRLVDPLAPGPDLPTLGHSVFDALFHVDDGPGRWSYRLPYPFTRLLARIDRHLPDDGRGNSSLKTVLIPLGRSNQRYDAAPDFFAYPRMIVAVDTEPQVTGGRRTHLLKDRLFLAYQARSSTLQVISYNERLGRFEFQVVSDYRAGGKPSVRYARRRWCLSCHQNAGPIFSRAPWDETNANIDIAARLAGRRPASDSGAVASPPAQATAIDNAIERANLFSAYQRLWGEGCGAGQQVVGCRAGALDAMLQYRLGAFAHIDTESDLFWEQFVPRAVGDWQRRWGDGLAIPEPDIPNRRPFDAAVPEHVRAEDNPLLHRPPRAIWTVGSLGRLVKGMSDLIPLADIRRLDQHLFERGRGESGWRWRFRGPCRFKHRGGLADGQLLSLECRLLGGAPGRAFDLVTDLFMESGRVTDRAMNSLQLSDGTRFSGLVHAGGAIRPSGDLWSVELAVRQQRNGLHVWLPDGSAVETIEIRWPRSASGNARLPPEPEFRGEAVLTLAPGFEAVPGAVSRLAERTRTDRRGALLEPTYRPTELMRELFGELGLPPTPWCCEALPAATRLTHPGKRLRGGG